MFISDKCEGRSMEIILENESITRDDFDAAD